MGTKRQMRLVKDKLASLTDEPNGEEAEICEAYAVGLFVYEILSLLFRCLAHGSLIFQMMRGPMRGSSNLRRAER